MTLLKVQAVAEQLNCSKSQVYDLIASHKLRHYRIGKGHGGIRISEEQIEEFLRGREQGGEESAKNTELFAQTKIKKLQHLHLD